MILPLNHQIWFYPKVIDFRKQLNGLMMLVIDTLGRNPGSGELFIFRDRTGKKLKMIYFDGQCFWRGVAFLFDGHALLSTRVTFWV